MENGIMLWRRIQCTLYFMLLCTFDACKIYVVDLNVFRNVLVFVTNAVYFLQILRSLRKWLFAQIPNLQTVSCPSRYLTHDILAEATLYMYIYCTDLIPFYRDLYPYPLPHLQMSHLLSVKYLSSYFKAFSVF